MHRLLIIFNLLIDLFLEYITTKIYLQQGDLFDIYVLSNYSFSE